jgi:hypothetical protein
MRFDEMRFDEMRFDEMRFDEMRFDEMHSEGSSRSAPCIRRLNVAES